MDRDAVLPPVARPARRLAAFALDYVLIALYLILLVGAGAFLTLGPFAGEVRRLLARALARDFFTFAVSVLPVMLYFALTEASARGASWGKRRMRLRVVTLSGQRLGLGRALIRSVVKFIPWQLAHFAAPRLAVAGASQTATVVWGGVAVLSMVLGAGYVAALWAAPHGRVPHDWAAGSVVVGQGQD